MPARIACAAWYGAVPAHTMPPPHGDVHISCDGAEVLVERGGVEVGENGTYMMPSMSAAARPASAIARSAASAPISRVVRPDAFV